MQNNSSGFFRSDGRAYSVFSWGFPETDEFSIESNPYDRLVARIICAAIDEFAERGAISRTRLASRCHVGKGTLAPIFSFWEFDTWEKS